MNTYSQKRDNVLLILANIVCVIYGILCVYLYYKQVIQTAPPYFESDLPYHVNMAVKDGWYYSFTAFVYIFLSMFPIGNLLIAIFLSAVTVGSVYAAYALIRQTAAIKIPDYAILLMAFCANIVMAFYISAVTPTRYLGYQSGTIWHNSTYICMKLFGILSLIIYFQYEKTYRQGMKIGQWLAFAAILALTTGIKPSFLMAFAPAMLLFIIIDVIKGTMLKRAFIWGLSVIPSLLIIIWQNIVLFGEDTGAGIEIKIGGAFYLHGGHVKTAIILSIIFPLYVTIFNIKGILQSIFNKNNEELSNKRYLFVWIMLAVGFLQAAFFTESGKRSLDLNFMWGYQFCIFAAFVFAILRFIQNIKDSNFIKSNRYLKQIYIAIGLFIFAGHLWTGIYFFKGLLEGMSYFYL